MTSHTISDAYMKFEMSKIYAMQKVMATCVAHAHIFYYYFY